MNPTLQPSDSFAAELRGFGFAGILAMAVILLTGNVFIGNIILPLGALLVLLWVRLSGTPWREVGYAAPRSWILTIAGGLVLGFVFKLLMKAVVMPLLGADPVNQAYHHLAGNRAMLPAAIWAMVVAGFAEETIFRGYLFERLNKLFGIRNWNIWFIVLITSILFGLSHYRIQGLPGVQQATIVGLVYGTIFSITNRIWLLMIAHASFNLTAFAIIYWDVETDVAHFFFK